MIVLLALLSQDPKDPNVITFLAFGLLFISFHYNYIKDLFLLLSLTDADDKILYVQTQAIRVPLWHYFIS